VSDTKAKISDLDPFIGDPESPVELVILVMKSGPAMVWANVGEHKVRSLGNTHEIKYGDVLTDERFVRSVRITQIEKPESKP
jgi:hypothetical protein